MDHNSKFDGKPGIHVSVVHVHVHVCIHVESGLMTVMLWQLLAKKMLRTKIHTQCFDFAVSLVETGPAQTS